MLTPVQRVGIGFVHAAVMIKDKVPAVVGKEGIMVIGGQGRSKKLTGSFRSTGCCDMLARILWWAFRSPLFLAVLISPAQDLLAATVSLTGAAQCYSGSPDAHLSFTVSGGTSSTFDLYRGGSLLSPSNTGTTFDNYPLTVGS